MIHKTKMDQKSLPIKNRQCFYTSELISRSYDEELTVGQKVFLHSHLMICQNCRHFAKNTQKLHQIMKAYQNKK